jgi:hypothetical protein
MSLDSPYCIAPHFRSILPHGDIKVIDEMFNNYHQITRNNYERGKYYLTPKEVLPDPERSKMRSLLFFRSFFL